MLKLFYKYFALLCTVCFALPFSSIASHIAGGEFFYKCLGNDRYQIQLNIYQDCLTGDAQAIAADTPAIVGVFNLDDGSGMIFDNLYPVSTISVPGNFSNQCVNNPPDTCLTKLTFMFVVTLRSNNSG